MLIAICDDEKEVRDLLAGKIKKLYPRANLCFMQAGKNCYWPGSSRIFCFGYSDARNGRGGGSEEAAGLQ